MGPPTVTSPGPPVRWAPWAVVGTGAVATGVGAVLLVNSNQAWTRFSNDRTLTPSEAASLAATGAAQRTGGVVAASLGVAAVGAGLAWYFLGAEQSHVAVTPAVDGAGLIVRGVW